MHAWGKKASYRINSGSLYIPGGRGHHIVLIDIVLIVRVSLGKKASYRINNGSLYMPGGRGHHRVLIDIVLIARVSLGEEGII